MNLHTFVSSPQDSVDVCLSKVQQNIYAQLNVIQIEQSKRKLTGKMTNATSSEL